jgi:transcriptional regulator with XRE-family HTH domain
MGQIRNTKLLKRMAVVLKQLREDQNLTQSMVYNDTNIHIGRIETAQANPTVSTISALCDYYKISESELYKRIESIK